MEIPSWRGRGGIRIPESGMTTPSSGSESASESVGSEVGDGAGIIGDAIGTTETSTITTTTTTPGAARFITGTTTTEAGEEPAELTANPEVRPTWGTGLPTGTPAGAAELTAN